MVPEYVLTFASSLVTLFMFATPALLVPMRLPQRDGFGLRALVGACATLVLFNVWTPAVDLASSEVIPVSDFVSMAAFFAVILTLMMLYVLFCYRISPLVACYCAVVAYSVQNLGASLIELFNLVTLHGESLPQLPMLLRMAFGCALMYALYYYLITKRFPRNASLAEPDGTVFALFLTVILVSIVFDMGVKRLPGIGIDMSYVLLFRVTQIVMVIAIIVLEYELLYSRNMQVQAATNERLMRDREAQYELSRDTIDAINIKMHDIRHQIRHLEDGSEGTTVLDKDVLRDIAREVSIYDATVKTGNDALDTILTEKSLLGSREGISLACIADGGALSFMAPSDLYALFGNAIENAFDAVRSLRDPERRNISLLVRRVANFASIHIENYYGGRVRFDEEGRPITSKGDAGDHGLGTRSMQMICESYGGTLSFEVDGTTFAVNMLIPIP